MPPSASSWFRSALLLGFALGGFFDGILLHQILEWHHLLSLVPGIDSLRAQMLWDGYFHALMYVLAVIGLVGLWRRRDEAGDLWAALPIGFGLWHVVDAVASHWLLGIHRIRVDSAQPLLWDLGWLIGFGLVPLAFGLERRRRMRTTGAVTLSLVFVLALGAGGLAARAPETESVAVVLAPWVRPAGVVDAVVAGGGRLVWADARLTTLVVELPARHRLGLYAHGALLVSGAGLPAGCLAWSRV